MDERSATPKNPVQDCKILKFREDRKIVTKVCNLAKTAVHDVTCDHVIYKTFETLIHKNYGGIFEITQIYSGEV